MPAAVDLNSSKPNIEWSCLYTWLCLDSWIGEKASSSFRTVLGSSLPLVFETLGGCSDGTVGVLSGIGCLLSQHLGLPIVDNVHHLF